MATKVGGSIADSQLPGGTDYIPGAGVGTSTIAPAVEPGMIPINTSQPQPTTTNPLPTVNPAANGTINPATGQMEYPQAPATGGQVQGTLPGQTTPTTFTSAEAMKQNGGSPIKQALAATKASGVPSPQDNGAGSAGVNNALANVPNVPDTSVLDDTFANDKDYQNLIADHQKYQQEAGKSLVDTYLQLEKDSGLQALDTKMLNLRNIIDGSEDDLRNEIKAAGGFATESQILGLTSARNKQNIKDYNNLVDTKKLATDRINTMVGLAATDKTLALQKMQEQMNFDQRILDYKDKFKKNAQEAYKNVITAVGYDGLLNSLMSSDPTGNSVSLAERTLGFQSGQLQQIVTQKKAQDNLKALEDYNVTTPYIIKAGGEVQNSATGEAYKDPEDFQARTGMTLDQAGSKGLIKKLGMKKEDIKDQRNYDLDVKKANSTIAVNNAQMAKIYHDMNEIKDRPTEQLDLGNGHKQLIYSDTGEVVKDYKPGDAVSAPAQQAQTKANIDLIGNVLDLAKNPTQVSIGINGFRDALVNPFSSKKSDFMAGVQQLTSQLTLDSLIRAKAQGATFGALSEGELNILAGSATKIKSWEIKDKTGSVVGYNTSGDSFKKELDKINNLAKLDYVLKGGNAPDVGIKQEANGDWTSTNSDGSVNVFNELKGFSPQKSSFNSVEGDTKKASVDKTVAAIGQFESGGNYKAIGPVTSSGDKAYGKYQVMGANIPSWTKQALGYSMTPQQFLNDKKAQDEVAKYQIGKHVANGYGVEDIASIWFTGQPLSKGGSKKDVIGTSGNKYASAIRALYDKG